MRRNQSSQVRNFSTFALKDAPKGICRRPSSFYSRQVIISAFPERLDGQQREGEEASLRSASDAGENWRKKGSRVAMRKGAYEAKPTWRDLILFPQWWRAPQTAANSQSNLWACQEVYSPPSELQSNPPQCAPMCSKLGCRQLIILASNPRSRLLA